MNCYSVKLDKAINLKLKDFFINDGAELGVQQSALWRAKTKSYNAVFYTTGKLLIQGSDVTEIVNKVNVFLGLSVSATKNNNPNSSVNDDVPVCHIGVDESGKGDFFGPLVIAGVLVDEQSTKILLDAGVKDCKKVEDKNINKLAAIVKNNCVFSIVTINPAKYNELYAKFNNLNKLLAWGHARVIENILEKKDCSYAISDKFGDEKLIKNALMNKGQGIHLEQKCKAESDIAVAAASIIARAQFLSVMQDLSVKYGIEIPKGASDKVVSVARDIKNRYSKDELKNAVKTHFKTFENI